MVERTSSHRFASLRGLCSTLLVLAASIAAAAGVVRIAAAHEDRDADDRHTHHRGWPMIGHDPADTRSRLSASSDRRTSIA
jgi:hypothetical protein